MPSKPAPTVTAPTINELLKVLQLKTTTPARQAKPAPTVTAPTPAPTVTAPTVIIRELLQVLQNTPALIVQLHTSPTPAVNEGQ
jgi:hypothetical protein